MTAAARDEGHPERTRAALDPERSVVVEACAGSGKTWLLVARIARALLAGATPGEILAITFTRKAAEEMRERLLRRLRDLALAPDDRSLDRMLEELGVPANDRPGLRARARGLLEAVLGASPQITLNTFHGWFAQLLGAAPLEFGHGSFALVDQVDPLIEEAFDTWINRLGRQPAAPPALALERLLRDYREHTTRRLLLQFMAHRTEWWAYTRGAPDPVAFACDRLATDLGVTPGHDPLTSLFGDPSFETRLSVAAAFMAERGEKRLRVAAPAMEALARPDPDRDLETAFGIVHGALHKQDGTLYEAVAKLLDKADDPRRDAFASLVEDVERCADARAETRVWAMNRDVLICGHALVGVYQRLKEARGVADFTDLEWRAAELVADSDHADYLQFRLDARYRHVLLDEFQDTSPLQWRVLRAWFEASAASGSAPAVFLVGDPKQAIYRFRGADARVFELAADFLQRELSAPRLRHNLSWRSAPAVIDTVNRLFENVRELAGFVRHEARHADMTGSVQLLHARAPSAPPRAADAGEFAGRALRDPLSEPREEKRRPAQEAEAAELARRIAATVGHAEVDGPDGRPAKARYRDILVLVQRRTQLDIYEAALRRGGIPYVTARLGGLLDALEARDIDALLRFLGTPSDDLALAHALKSPLFSCTEDDLLSLARGEPQGWWNRLRDRVSEPRASPSLGRAHRLLQRWLDLVGTVPLHDLLDRVYFEGDAVRRFRAAVPPHQASGVEANLVALMELALENDAGRYPTLSRFLDDLRRMRDLPDRESPREGGLPASFDAVRIMTVHGAKGLEAPIVWVLATSGSKQKEAGLDVLVDWPPTDDRPRHFSILGRVKERGKARAGLIDEERAAAARESANLLYVALTRARQTLIVSGCERDGGDWYARIAAVLPETLVESRAEPARATPAPEPTPMPFEPEPLAHGPVGRRVAVESDPARREGIRLHALLEALAARTDLTDADLASLIGADDSEGLALCARARAIVGSPELRRYFDPTRHVRAHNEVSYADSNGEVRRIDRLVEFEDEVWVLDYKTGLSDQPPEERAMRHREQLLAYRDAVTRLFPGRRARALLVFEPGRGVEVVPDAPA